MQMVLLAGPGVVISTFASGILIHVSLGLVVALRKLSFLLVYAIECLTENKTHYSLWNTMINEEDVVNVLMQEMECKFQM